MEPLSFDRLTAFAAAYLFVGAAHSLADGLPLWIRIATGQVTLDASRALLPVVSVVLIAASVFVAFRLLVRARRCVTHALIYLIVDLCWGLGLAVWFTNQRSLAATWPQHLSSSIYLLLQVAVMVLLYRSRPNEVA